MTNVQTLAKNIICGREVEVTVIGQYSETQTEVMYDNLNFIVSNTDIVTVNVEDAKADDLATWLQEVLNVQSSQSYTGDGNSIDLSFDNNKQTFWMNDEWTASEVITVIVHADGYEVETLNAEKEYKNSYNYDADYVEASNRRTIKKLATLDL